MDREPGKTVRRKRSAPCAETLRREALRQLKQRLEEGEMSTADLIRIMGMSLKEEERTEEAADWVLELKEEA